MKKKRKDPHHHDTVECKCTMFDSGENEREEVVHVYYVLPNRT